MELLSHDWSELKLGQFGRCEVRTEDLIINLVESPRVNWSFGDGFASFAL